MAWESLGRSILAGGSMLVATSLLPVESSAQADYPTSAGLRAGIGAYGTFDVDGGQTHSIADLKEGDVYRVCILGKGGKLIVDSTKEVPLDNGDCHDAFGLKFDFRADDGGETNGFYSHPRRDRYRHWSARVSPRHPPGPPACGQRTSGCEPD